MTLNVPAGLWGKKQFSCEEVVESKKISTARIHVEPAIKYLKDYKIVKHTVPRRILPYLSKIFYVCCHLTNLQPIKLREIDGAMNSMVTH